MSATAAAIMEPSKKPRAPLSSLSESLRQEWEARQARLSHLVVENDDDLPWALPSENPTTTKRPLRLIGGVDLSFVNEKREEGGSDEEEEVTPALACLVILSFPDLQVLHESYQWTNLTLPYMSGFLAFREVEPLISLIDQLKTDHPELVPGVILVDGNGILHARACGLACHLGLETGIPTVGCAKTFLHVDGLHTVDVRAAVAQKVADVAQEAEGKEKEEDDALKGICYQLVGDSGKVWGAALVPSVSFSLEESLSSSVSSTRGRSRKISNPIFVSVGTGLSLETALQIVDMCCHHRVPEPIRQADIRSRARIREMGLGGGKAHN